MEKPGFQQEYKPRSVPFLSLLLNLFQLPNSRQSLYPKLIGVYLFIAVTTLIEVSLAIVFRGLSQNFKWAAMCI